MLLCGGAAVPLALMQAFEERHGVKVVQAWGLTETSPVGSLAIPPAGAAGEEHWSTGKFDKKLLREQLRTGHLAVREVPRSATAPGSGEAGQG